MTHTDNDIILLSTPLSTHVYTKLPEDLFTSVSYYNSLFEVCAEQPPPAHPWRAWFSFSCLLSRPPAVLFAAAGWTTGPGNPAGNVHEEQPAAGDQSTAYRAAVSSGAAHSYLLPGQTRPASFPVPPVASVWLRSCPVMLWCSGGEHDDVEQLTLPICHLNVHVA